MLSAVDIVMILESLALKDTYGRVLDTSTLFSYNAIVKTLRNNQKEMDNLMIALHRARYIELINTLEGKPISIRILPEGLHVLSVLTDRLPIQ